MNRPYIGVSGFMSTKEARAALAMYRDAWSEAGRTPTHDLMLGVLASRKTLAGDQNRYPLRYPRREDIAGIFVDDSLALNLVHVAMDLSEIWTAPKLPTEGALAGGAACAGVQINIPPPTDPYDRGGFKALVGAAKRQAKRVVLQVRPGALSAERIAAGACFYAGGGNLDLDKVRAYLRAAVELFTGAST